jgi:hypothetical protein
MIFEVKKNTTPQHLDMICGALIIDHPLGINLFSAKYQGINI